MGLLSRDLCLELYGDIKKMNVVYLWGGEEKRFEFSNKNHLFISKLIFNYGFGRSSYVTVYIANKKSFKPEVCSS